jgi:hypothetical protein
MNMKAEGNPVKASYMFLPRHMKGPGNCAESSFDPLHTKIHSVKLLGHFRHMKRKHVNRY